MMLFRISKSFKRYQVERGEYHFASRFFSGVVDDGAAIIHINTFTDQTYIISLVTHIASTGNVRYEFFEDSVVTNNGTEITVFNACRCANNSIINAKSYYAPTIQSNGTKIYEALIPGGTKAKAVGGSDGTFPSDFLRLKRNSNYILKVTNISGSTEDISINILMGESY